MPAVIKSAKFVCSCCLEPEEFDPGDAGQLGENMVIDEIERRFDHRAAGFGCMACRG